MIYMLAFHAMQVIVPDPIKRYPDLYWIANNAFSFAVFKLIYVFAHCKMLEWMIVFRVKVKLFVIAFKLIKRYSVFSLKKIIKKEIENRKIKKPLPAGIEPATFRLTAERSTNWATEARYYPRTGSN